MRIPSFQIILIALVTASPFLLHAQLPKVMVEKIQHPCAEVPGSIHLLLEGDTSNVSYLWSNGERSLKANNLDEGLYVFKLRGELDCEEKEYEFKLRRLGTRELILDQYDIADCKVRVEASIVEGISTQDLTGYNIVWSDSVKNTLSRGFRKTNSAQSIWAILRDNGSCLSENKAYSMIPAHTGCNSIKSNPTVLVNEFSKRDDPEGEYIELLVVGDGICGNTTDIRNYVITNSAGIMDTISTAFASKSILQFADIAQWSNVPNGSLITIYDRAKRNKNIPADDVNDANHDDVYIFSSSNSVLLNGNYSSRITNDTLTFNSLTSFAPAWEAIDLKSSNRSGIHIRYPNGNMCHGYTVSNSSPEQRDSIPFVFINTVESDCGCMLDGADFLTNVAYSCDSISQTPGRPNSIANANFISSLKDCHSVFSKQTINGNDESSRSVFYSADNRKLKVYPNPTSDYVYVAMSTETGSSASLHLFNSLGNSVLKQKINLSESGNVNLIKLPKDIQPGLYFLHCKYSDGKVETTPIVILNK